MVCKLEDLVVGAGDRAGSCDCVVVYFFLEFLVGLVVEALEALMDAAWYSVELLLLSVL